MKSKFDKKRALIYLVVILAALIIFYMYSSQNCGTDTACFNKNTASCKLSKLTMDSQGSTLLYEIRGSSGNSCIVNVKMLKLAEGTPIDVTSKLEGKSMVCKIDRGFNTELLEKLDKTLNSCTGPLKESMLELIIEKMYALIIQNMGKITIDLQGVLNQTNVQK